MYWDGHYWILWRLRAVDNIRCCTMGGQNLRQYRRAHNFFAQFFAVLSLSPRTSCEKIPPSSPLLQRYLETAAPHCKPPGFLKTNSQARQILAEIAWGSVSRLGAQSCLLLHPFPLPREWACAREIRAITPPPWGTHRTFNDPPRSLASLFADWIDGTLVFLRV